MKYGPHGHLLNNPSAWLLAQLAVELGLRADPPVVVEVPGEQMELIEKGEVE